MVGDLGIAIGGVMLCLAAINTFPICLNFTVILTSSSLPCRDKIKNWIAVRYWIRLVFWIPDKEEDIFAFVFLYRPPSPLHRKVNIQ